MNLPRRIIQYFWEDFDALGMERPEVTPRATQHISEMIDIIAKLLENGHAYESEGSIYYRISAFPTTANFQRSISPAILPAAANGSTPINTKRKTLVTLLSGNLSGRTKSPAGMLRLAAAVRAGISSARRCR